MNETTIVLAISAVMISGILSTTYFTNQVVLGALNCNAEITDCHGGSGSRGGGNGGHFTLDNSIFTESGGGGGAFPQGGHGVFNFATGESVVSGGNPSTGGGRTVCDTTGCQTTGKP